MPGQHEKKTPYYHLYKKIELPDLFDAVYLNDYNAATRKLTAGY
jgi:hypothetical protein